ncbi:MAG: DUF3300 domain-containing protein [Acidobacteriota bacterium]
MRTLRFLLSPLVACAILAGGLSLHAQGSLYSPDQINQMVAPIALYPDALMSQVLMAATFPDQVTQADQWLQANPNLTGSELDDALATATWDPSVIALCKFPSVLHRMAQNITWTTDLGNAFLNQRTDVMNAVQTLRAAAYRNGYLQTTPQQRVVVEGPDIVIQPYTPDVIYVPAYQPAVVYGPLWSYPTYYYPDVWAPWPGYSFVNGFAWGLGFAVGNVLFGGCDWNDHTVYVNNTVIVNNAIYHNTPYYRGGYWHGRLGPQTWSPQVARASYVRGGIGAPYGGRAYGRIHGISARPGGYQPRTMERAGVNGPRSLEGRGTHLPAVHGPTGFAARGASRPGVRGPTGYPKRTMNRAGVHGPTGYTARGSNLPAVHGPTGYNAGRTYTRPAVHGPTGYTTRGYNRPAVHGPEGYTRPAYNRPAYHPPTSYSRPQYSRPSYRAPAYRAPSYRAPAYRAPAYRPPANYARPSYHPAYAPRAGAVGHAPAAPHGGHVPHKRG